MILSGFDMLSIKLSSSLLGTPVPLPLTPLSAAQVGIYRCFRRCGGWMYRVELGIGSGAIVVEDLGDVGDVEHSEKTRCPVNGLVALKSIYENWEENSAEIHTYKEFASLRFSRE